jgi:ligand-binding sensor domain-containing protein
VRAVQPASEGSVWFGSAGGANFYQDPNWESYTEADGLAGNDIRALALDSQSRTWIGSETGLSIWTGNGFFNLTTDNGLPSDVITSLLSDGDLVWIGTDMGLLRFQDNQLQVFNTGNINLPSNGITALALDADGSLLVGTESGLARFRDSDIMTVPDIPSEPVQSIAAGETGEIWVATVAGELYYFDGAQWTAATNIPELPSPLVSALYIDGNGDVWFGADGGGLAVASQ